MARRRQPQRAAAIRRNQLQPSVAPTEDNTQASSTPTEDNLSSTLTQRSPAPTDDPEPTVAPAPLSSTEEVFKLFMQTYIDIVKNQAQIQPQSKSLHLH